MSGLKNNLPKLHFLSTEKNTRTIFIDQTSFNCQNKKPIHHKKNEKYSYF